MKIDPAVSSTPSPPPVSTVTPSKLHPVIDSASPIPIIEERGTALTLEVESSPLPSAPDAEIVVHSKLTTSQEKQDVSATPETLAVPQITTTPAATKSGIPMRVYSKSAAVNRLRKSSSPVVTRLTEVHLLEKLSNRLTRLENTTMNANITKHEVDNTLKELRAELVNTKQYLSLLRKEMQC